MKPTSAVLLAVALVTLAEAVPAQERTNYFNDPFIRVTRGIADCPVPDGPLMTTAEAQAGAHARAERGTRCYLEGKCRLPNSYMYDKEIIPRVEKAILADGRFADTSVWAEGQRRWVFLKGCVRSKDQAVALEKLVGEIDDVERVIDQLSVRTAQKLNAK